MLGLLPFWGLGVVTLVHGRVWLFISVWVLSCDCCSASHPHHDGSRSHLSLGFGVTPPRPEPPASSSQPALPWVCFILVSGTFEGRVSAPGPMNSSQEAGFPHVRPGLLGQSRPEDSRVAWLCKAGGLQTGPPTNLEHLVPHSST